MRTEHNQYGHPLYKCDRCGEDTRKPAGAENDWTPDSHDNSLEGHFSFQGAYGSTRYDYELWKAELCESCCEKVRDFINEHAETTGARGVLVIDSMEADRQFCQEVLGKDPARVVRGGPDHQENQDKFRQWLEDTYRLRAP